MYKICIERADTNKLAVKVNDSYRVGYDINIHLDNIEFIFCLLSFKIYFYVMINKNCVITCNLSIRNHEFTLNDTCRDIIGLKYDQLILTNYKTLHTEKKSIEIPFRETLDISKNNHCIISLHNSTLGISMRIWLSYKNAGLFYYKAYPSFTEHPFNDDIKMLIDGMETEYIIDTYIDKTALHTKPAKCEEFI